MNTLGRTSIALVVLAAGLLSGCAESGPEPAPPTWTDNPFPLPSVVAPTPPTIAAGCTAELPQRLTFTPARPQDAEAVAGLTGCTDGWWTSVDNAPSSEVVWAVEQPAGLVEPTPVPLSRPDVALFREILGRQEPRMPLLEPGIGVTLPFPPQSVQLVIDARVNAAWASQRLVLDQVFGPIVDQAKDKGPDVLSGGGPVRKAAMTCGLAGYEFGSNLGEVTDPDPQPDDPAPQLTDYLGLGADTWSAGVKCADAIRDAENQATVLDQKVSLVDAKTKARQLGTSTWARWGARTLATLAQAR